MRDFTTDASKWDRATVNEYNATVREAYDNAAEQVDPSIACINDKGSVDTDCPCRTCTASRAAHAKSLQLARPADFEKLSVEKKTHYLLHPSKRRNWTKEDYDKWAGTNAGNRSVETPNQDATLNQKPDDWTAEEWANLTPDRRARIIEINSRKQAV